MPLFRIDRVKRYPQDASIWIPTADIGNHRILDCRVSQIAGTAGAEQGNGKWHDQSVASSSGHPRYSKPSIAQSAQPASILMELFLQ